MRSFVYSSRPYRVLFGTGTLRELPAEVRRLGCQRALLVTTPGRSEPAQAALDALGPLGVAHFRGAAMHTPVEVTQRAMELVREYGVDCLVSLGGGSATGLAKALALRTGLPQVAVPTTYAGSEVTATVGQTEGGVKTTASGPVVLPGTVIYDVELTHGLPVETSVTSGVNALAHAVEALYSPAANPATDSLALQAIRRMAAALPQVATDPSDVDARAEALTAAWLAGTCLGTVGSGLHHKLCHVLGGSFDLPHSPTHTVVLPHVMAHNAPAVPDVMRRIAEALGVRDAPTGMYDLIVSLGGPVSLRELGMAGSDLPKVVEAATAAQYPNPVPVTADGVAALLDEAWEGRRPAPRVPDLTWLTRQVVDSFAGTPDARARQLVTGLVRHLHEYAVENDLTESEWLYGIDFLTRAGHITTGSRQEFVLLSDTLGVSSVVDALTNSRTPDTTASAVLGPFYVDGAPVATQGADISAGMAGTPLWVDVCIVDLEGAPVPQATVDVWQSNEDGFYDVQLPDLPGPALRARFHTDEAGRVRFWSILPSEYPIPRDGPVGQLLEAAGRHAWRAPHLHFMIFAAGYRRLVTQLFVAGGAYLDSDAVFGVKDELIVEFTRREGQTPDGRPIEGEWRSVDFTFRISPA